MSGLRGIGGRGALLVALAAALWGTDALFRRGLALRLPAVEVVFWEHLLLAAVTLPLVLRAAPRLRVLSRADWLAVAVVGGGSSVAATVLFTEALSQGNPTLPLLLQKLQPIFAVAGAWLLLGERLRRRYFGFAAVALAGSYLVTFAEPGTLTTEGLRAAALGGGAALLWALGTVLGKRVTAKVEAAPLTALRFLFGLPVATILLLLDGGPLTSAQPSDAPAIVLLALVPGLLALLLYYRGLTRTTASAATLSELAFPLSAVTVNAIAFGVTLTSTQVLGAVLLAGAVTALGIADGRGTRATGVVVPARLGGTRTAPG